MSANRGTRKGLGRKKRRQPKKVAKPDREEHADSKEEKRPKLIEKRIFFEGAAKFAIDRIKEVRGVKPRDTVKKALDYVFQLLEVKEQGDCLVFRQNGTNHDYELDLWMAMRLEDSLQKAKGKSSVRVHFTKSEHDIILKEADRVGRNINQFITAAIFFYVHFLKISMPGGYIKKANNKNFVIELKPSRQPEPV